ncbi:MAG: hypothetical protein FJX04_04315 [Alphaproteobacteria bacterium]|nr:hypothetical protein [Alphaproteobacteria bacterium]
MIAIDSSAISVTGWGYAQNEGDLDAWASAVNDGRLPIHRGLVLSADDLLRRDAIEKLMCDMIVDLESVAHHHGVDPAIFLEDLDRLQSLTRDSLVQIEGWKVIIPPHARLAMRSVASVFDTHLMEVQNRHAAAV